MSDIGAAKTRQADPSGRTARTRCVASVCPLVLAVTLLLTACSETSMTPAEVSELEPPAADVDTEASADRASAVTITYLANEGFLLEAGEHQVLIDALFGEGLEGYPTIPQPHRDEIEHGRGRFRGIDCVLATHAHADHFSPRAVARLLDRVPAQFVSTQEAVEELVPLLAPRHAPAPRSLRPARHQIEAVACSGVAVSAMSFHHGRLMVPNLAFLIDLGGLTVLHVGDTEITAEEIRPWGLDAQQIDIALLPAWHLTEAAWLPVLAEISARHVVAMHLASPDAPPSWFGSAGSLDNRIAEIRQQVPAAWIPTEAMEARVFEAEE